MAILLSERLLKKLAGGGVGTPIPAAGPTIGINKPQKYKMHVRKKKGPNGDYLVFYYSDYPKPKHTKDKPLDMRVPSDCFIELKLDDRLDWNFPAADALTLGKASVPSAGDPATRYGTFRRVDDKTVTFHAPFVAMSHGGNGGRGPANVDQLNILVELAQPDIDGVKQPPLVLLIDPGIKNPGDDTVPVITLGPRPPLKTRRKAKKGTRRS